MGARDLDNSIRDFIGSFFVGEMSKTGQLLDARLRKKTAHVKGALGRNRAISGADKQMQRRLQARQIALQRAEIPVRHHVQRRADMR